MGESVGICRKKVNERRRNSLIYCEIFHRLTRNHSRQHKNGVHILNANIF